MKITQLVCQTFHYQSDTVRDSEGHSHPGPAHDARQTLLRIVTDSGVEGYAFGADADAIRQYVAPALLGQDPFYRERLWRAVQERQRLFPSLLDRTIGVVDCALWDLAGRALQTPVYKLLGGFRDKLRAYASTMCGDELPGGLDTPEAFAKFALECKQRGYRSFKLHTWQPPVPGAPDVRRDLAACAAVREAVGPEMDLMIDPFHYYSRMEALQLAKGLEQLNYHWMEEPMDEHSISSYVWLTGQTTLPIVGPETAEGKLHTRAEWILRGAADVSRGGVGDIGGITPLMKLAHLCEAHGMAMEVHGNGAANLHALCAMAIPGEYYERGLLHPFVDYEKPKPWLNSIDDPLDADGCVRVSQQPGLGQDINFDYIHANLLTA